MSKTAKENVGMVSDYNGSIDFSKHIVIKYIFNSLREQKNFHIHKI